MKNKCPTKLGGCFCGVHPTVLPDLVWIVRIAAKQPY
jgi:hypothetical protein